MSDEDEKGQPENVLPESSDGDKMDVEAGGGPPSVIEKENPVNEPSVLSFEGTSQEEDASNNATEEIKEATNVQCGDAEIGNVEQMVNGKKDRGDISVKEEESNLAVVQVDDGETLSTSKEKEAQSGEHHLEEMLVKQDIVDGECPVPAEGSNRPFIWDPRSFEGDGSGTEEEQAAFMKELESFHKEMSLEFKPPKFYGEGLNCLKLWRAVTRLGGYDQVTSCKLWRQVGESFNPPKTCTTVSWSFRCFYEKALLEYEKHKIRTGELRIALTIAEPISVENQVKSNQPSGSGRTIRDAAARAMQGWHSQRLLGNGEVGEPNIKDKSSISLFKRDKQLRSVGLFKRKKASSLERCVKVARPKISDPETDSMVVDVGPPADWVKINVRKTKDCFEVYALVPGLLREEVHVQSDPAGRLVISGEPEQLDNPWGVTPFKKIVTLPSRIDPHQTSAVVTLHGQLFVRAPFEL